MAEYKFTYTASDTAPDVQTGQVDVSELDKLTAIVDFTDADSGVRFFHDGKGTLYCVLLDANQNIVTSNGKIDLRNVRQDVKFEDGKEYTMESSGSAFKLIGFDQQLAGSSEIVIDDQGFGMDSGEPKASAPGGNTAAESDSAAEDAATEAEKSAAETETEASETETEASETEAPAASEEEQSVDAAEVQADVSSDGEVNLIATAAQEDGLAVEALTETVEPVPVKTEGGNGILVWAICATAVAVAAAAACALLLKKAADSDKTRKIKDTELKSLQRSAEDKTTALTKGQERIRELENQLADANTKINELRDEANTKAAAVASAHERLESRPTTEELQEANARAEELQQKYDTLYIRTRDLMRENEQYAARIRELEHGGAAASSAPAAADTPDAAPAEPAASVNEPDAFLICTSESELGKYSDPTFVAPASSMAGEGTMLNQAPFRRASLVVIGGKAYLNPHFFRALGEGMENYTNLAGLGGVFETEGLGSSAVTYRLSEIVPAKVSYDAATDAFHVDQRGKLVLRIG